MTVSSRSRARRVTSSRSERAARRSGGGLAPPAGRPGRAAGAAPCPGRRDRAAASARASSTAARCSVGGVPGRALGGPGLAQLAPQRGVLGLVLLDLRPVAGPQVAQRLLGVGELVAQPGQLRGSPRRAVSGRSCSARRRRRSDVLPPVGAAQPGHRGELDGVAARGRVRPQLGDVVRRARGDLGADPLAELVVGLERGRDGRRPSRARRCGAKPATRRSAGGRRDDVGQHVGGEGHDARADGVGQPAERGRGLGHGRHRQPPPARRRRSRRRATSSTASSRPHQRQITEATDSDSTSVSSTRWSPARSKCQNSASAGCASRRSGSGCRSRRSASDGRRRGSRCSRGSSVVRAARCRCRLPA